MTSMKRTPLAIAVITATLLSGCATGPDYIAPEQSTDYEWQQQIAGTDTQTQDVIETKGWWKQFNDLLLNSYVDQALDANLTLATMAGRVSQAQSWQVAVSALKMPVINVGAGYTAGKISENDPLLGGFVTPGAWTGTGWVIG